MSGCCDDKVFEGMSDGYKRALLAVILINAVMFFVEITAGLKSGSQALLADSLQRGQPCGHCYDYLGIVFISIFGRYGSGSGDYGPYRISGTGGQSHEPAHFDALA